METAENEPGNYPWTDSGLQLLTHLKAMIQAEGGREELAQRAQRELNQFLKIPSIKTGWRRHANADRDHCRFTATEDQFIKDSWHALPLNEIADQIDRSDKVTSRRGHKLGLGRKVPIFKNQSLKSI